MYSDNYAKSMLDLGADCVKAALLAVMAAGSTVYSGPPSIPYSIAAIGAIVGLGLMIKADKHLRRSPDIQKDRFMATWELKKNAFLAALQIVDSKLSRTTFVINDAKTKAEEQRKIPVGEIRACHSNLCLVAEDQTISELFFRLQNTHGDLSKNSSDWTRLLNELRNRMRRELGLTETEFNLEITWLGRSG